jgi:glutamate transport system substrate-binding protein
MSLRTPTTRTRVGALGAAVVLALSLTACGDDSSSGGETDVTVEENPDFPADSTMAQLADDGKMTIGVKIDQPGIGNLEPGADAPEGFDIEIGRMIAGGLGISDDNIEWLETISDNREPFIKSGKVDLVVASYSITDDRREIVGQAGPYYVTGQQLLVREDDKDKITGPDDLSGLKVCSVEGSTSLATAQDEYGADPVPLATYSECVDQLNNNTVDVVTTDGAILLGYEAEDPDNLQVVGEPFSEERYGVGYTMGDTEMCEFIQDTIKDAQADGTWAEAFENTLGQSGVDTPEPPDMDPCQ